VNIVSTLILSFSMSADAFAVALGKGTLLHRRNHKPSLYHACSIGLLFGIIEGITPLIGWLIGHAASKAIESIDHWIALIILGGLGLKMLYESTQPHRQEEETPKQAKNIVLLILTAVATSIDALAVGVTLAFVDANIWLAAAAIGATTFLMVSIGILVGYHMGTKLGRWAEALGGIGLIIIGVKIFTEHMGIMPQ
jgi:putative Mn2+ efflux pump MntP